MKTTDMKIIQEIRGNSRMNLTTISRRTGIPVSTIFDRLKRHEDKLVKKFTAIVDFAELGYPIKANIFLKVPQQTMEGAKTHLLCHEQVNNLYRVNNGYNLAVEGVFRDMKEMEDFIANLEHKYGVTEKFVFHIIEEIAREKTMSTLNES